MTATKVIGLWLVIAGCAILVVLLAPHASTTAGVPTMAPHSAPTTVNGCTDPHTALFNPCAHLDTTQTRDARPSATVTAYECDEVAAHVFATQDYTGSPDEQACLGEEDDPRVGLALDYGLTTDGYAAAERGER